jgi:hypothetical protein
LKGTLDMFYSADKYSSTFCHMFQVLRVPPGEPEDLRETKQVLRF